MRDQGIKSQDIMILLRLFVGTTHGDDDPIMSRRFLTYYEKKAWGHSDPPLFLMGLNQKALAAELGLSVAEMSLAAGRCQASGLLNADWSVRTEPFMRMLEHGLRYFLPPGLGPDTLGVPTAWGHPEAARLLRGPDARVPVWPSDAGSKLGPAMSPLFRTAPLIVSDCPRLYAALSAADLLRLGGARECEAGLALLYELKR